MIQKRFGLGEQEEAEAENGEENKWEEMRKWSTRENDEIENA
jgi:hypothetical protein